MTGVHGGLASSRKVRHLKSGVNTTGFAVLKHANFRLLVKPPTTVDDRLLPEHKGRYPETHSAGL